MKEYQIIFSSFVPEKLKNILDYIAIESPENAFDVVDGITKQIRSLSVMPARFPLVPENISYKNYPLHHCFYKKSFRIIYTIHKDKNIVRILDVRHSAQDYFLGTELN